MKGKQQQRWAPYDRTSQKNSTTPSAETGFQQIALEAAISQGVAVNRPQPDLQRPPSQPVDSQSASPHAPKPRPMGFYDVRPPKSRIAPSTILPNAEKLTPQIPTPPDTSAAPFITRFKYDDSIPDCFTLYNTDGQLAATFNNRNDVLFYLRDRKVPYSEIKVVCGFQESEETLRARDSKHRRALKRRQQAAQQSKQ